MNTENKKALRGLLKAELRREPKLPEEANMENDALLIARYALERVSVLEERVKLLERPKI